MNSIWFLQEYFATYLRNIRQVSERSVGHYLDAINWIGRFLHDKGLVHESIYEVTDLTQLQSLRNILFNYTEFQELNRRGHQMYSAGLNNYLRFAEAHDFTGLSSRLYLLDKPIPKVEESQDSHNSWKRSAIIRDQVLEAADYHCEIDHAHKTFIQKDTQHEYAEGHHIIALHNQQVFPYSLDVYANIICLCPICHRFLHYGTSQDKQPIIRHLYGKRADRFANSGIRLSLSEFEQLVL